LRKHWLSSIQWQEHSSSVTLPVSGGKNAPPASHRPE
jgi:hypothetical protein